MLVVDTVEPVVVSPLCRASCYGLRLDAAPSTPVHVSIECAHPLIDVEPKTVTLDSLTWQTRVFVRAKIAPRPQAATTEVSHVAGGESVCVPVEFVATAARYVMGFGFPGFRQVAVPSEPNRSLELMKKMFPRQSFDEKNHVAEDDCLGVSSDSDLDDQDKLRRGKAASILELAAGDKHSLVLTSDGQLYEASGGPLARLDLEEPQLDDLLPRRLRVCGVACGASHSAAVTTDGQVWTWGENKFGQLGLGTTKRASKPQRVDALSGAELVACGGAHTLVAVGDGELYAFGNGRTGALGLTAAEVRLPQRVDTPGRVVSISCGSLHSAVIDTRGTVLTCGADESWQLGRIEGARDIFAPVPGLKATQVSCGGAHTLLVSSRGTVYACGDNAYGQLGLGPDTARRRKPTRIWALDVDVASVSAGDAASAAVTPAGLVYVWGQRACGQLGDAGVSDVLDDLRLPSLAPTPSRCRVRRLVFGRSHTLALADLTLAAARKAHKRRLAFVRDIKGHVRFVRIFDKGDKARQNFRTSYDGRRWLRALKAHNLLSSVDYHELLAARVAARADGAIRKARLDAILKKAASSQQRADLFKVCWVDRVAALRRAQTRLGGGRAHDAFRLNAVLLLHLLGLRKAVSLRALAHGFVVVLDLALITHVETLLRQDRASRLRGGGGGGASSTSKGPAPAPPPLDDGLEEEAPPALLQPRHTRRSVFNKRCPPEAPPPPRPPSTRRRRRPRRPSSSFGVPNPTTPLVPDMLEACAPILDRYYVTNNVQLVLPPGVSEKRRSQVAARQRTRAEAERRSQVAVRQDRRTKQFHKYLRLVKEGGTCKD